MPISVELEVHGVARYFTRGDELLEWLIGHAPNNARTSNARRWQTPNSLSPVSPQLPWMPQQEALTAKDLEERIGQWEKKVRGNWSDCEDHLAATAWPGLKFLVRNTGEVFLNDVQIIITITGARGLEWIAVDRFKKAKLFPPVIPPAPNPYASAIDLDTYDAIRPPGYPISWRNLDRDYQLFGGSGSGTSV
jgi:hypothetical protein